MKVTKEELYEALHLLSSAEIPSKGNCEVCIVERESSRGVRCHHRDDYVGCGTIIADHMIRKAKEKVKLKKSILG
jgi:hypothetical protein